MVGRRLRLGLLGLLGGIALGLAGSAAGWPRTLASPSLAPDPIFALSPAPVRDRVLAAPPRSLASDEWWGGPITNSRGETFNFYVSRQYAEDEAARARWANFLGWALHGPEIKKLNVYQAPLARVGQLCGSAEAAACYIVQGAQLIFPGDVEDPQEGALNLSEILLHEYGHHIAANRRNDPWPAFTYGAKRWASFENICTRADRLQVRPGDEGRYYLLNPGEAFAETYRLLNVRRAQQSNSAWYSSWGQPLPWRWQAFSHTDATLAALRKDVANPWSGPRTLRWAGRTPRKAKGSLFVAKSFMAERRIFTPLDGVLTIVLNSAPKGAYIGIERGLGRDVEARRSITTAVCGETSVLLDVKTIRPRGKFRVTISVP